MSIERVLVIVGCQRSGTTLTGQILGAHPAAVLIDEFDGVYPWFHALMTDTADDTHAARLIAQAATKYGPNSDRFLDERNGPHLSQSITILVLKTPNLTYDEDLVARMPWPVTVVYPIRDPRAVAASMAKLESVDFVANQMRLIAQRPSARIHDAAAATLLADERESLWTRRGALWRIKSGRKAEFERAGCAVYAFRYEDLVHDSAAVIGAMFQACGLNNPESGAAAHMAYSGLGPGGTDRTRPVDKASLRGRDTLTPAQQADIMTAAAPLAEQLGYV